MRSMLGKFFAVLVLLLARQTAYGEGYERPDHLWMLWAGSPHPLGIAWDKPEWHGIRSSTQIWLGFGMGRPIAVTLPLALLGALIVFILATVVYVLCRRFSKSKHHDR